MYHVTFKDGWMTKIHTHESEQTLIATTNSPEHTPLQDIGRGFVVLIEKSEGSETNNDLEFNISKPIFLDRVGALSASHEMYFIVMVQEVRTKISLISQLEDQR